MYEAIIARVSTRKHPNADRVQLGNVMGYQVVVGLDTKDGELGVFFPVDGQLSDAFCRANKLYIKDPDTGEPMGGYFDTNRRVRAQRFRGEISEGMWMPLASINATIEFATGEPAILIYVEGDRCTHAGAAGVELCRKYETPATKRAQQVVRKTSKRRELKNFPKHYDTPQLRENLEQIRPDSRVVITEKLHGTSARTGYIMAPAPRWYHRAWNWLAARLPLPRMEPPEDLLRVSGTRNCLLSTGAAGEKGEAYRQRCHDIIAPHLFPGEVVYYEIVGTPAGMDSHPTKDLDKADRKLLAQTLGGECPERIHYNYGKLDGEFGIYVYRITRAGDDLTWYELEVRCEDLGLPTVPVLQLVKGEEVTLELCNELTRGASTLDKDTLREGICVREEWPDDGGVQKTLKHKSYLFCALEGIRKNDAEYVDAEDAA